VKAEDKSQGKVPLYHCTLTKHVKSIEKKGILILQTSNWVKAGDQSRYGGGYIFAFTALKDAYRWALKWDWSISSKMGSGKISIIEFAGDPATWEIDDADPFSQALNQGQWLKKVGCISRSEIQRSFRVMPDAVKEVTLRHN
jgi:hypothetical protein